MMAAVVVVMRMGVVVVMGVALIVSFDPTCKWLSVAGNILLELGSVSMNNNSYLAIYEGTKAWRALPLRNLTANSDLRTSRAPLIALNASHWNQLVDFVGCGCVLLLMLSGLSLSCSTCTWCERWALLFKITRT